MEINPKAQVRIELVESSIPVLFVENFYADPHAVRELALNSAFDETGALYPGRHAPIDTEGSREVLRRVCNLLTAVGNRVYETRTAQTDFSVLTAKASSLISQQKHPHIDPTPVLGIVYLNPHLTQGTCLFYNEVLKTHSITSEGQSAAFAKFMEEQGPNCEPEGYKIDNNPVWKKIYTIDGIFNRLVVYPGNVFHAIDADYVPETTDLKELRLTQRIIIHHTSLKQ